VTGWVYSGPRKKRGVERLSSRSPGIVLIDALLKREITSREFFEQADKLSDKELRNLHRILAREYIKQKRKRSRIG
jgi:hypothetical protein